MVAYSGAASAGPSLQRTSGSWSSGRWSAWWRPKPAEDTYVGRLLTWLRIRKRSATTAPPSLRRTASDLFDRPSGGAQSLHMQCSLNLTSRLCM